MHRSPSHRINIGAVADPQPTARTAPELLPSASAVSVGWQPKRPTSDVTKINFVTVTKIPLLKKKNKKRRSADFKKLATGR